MLCFSSLGRGDGSWQSSPGHRGAGDRKGKAREDEKRSLHTPGKSSMCSERNACVQDAVAGGGQKRIPEGGAHRAWPRAPCAQSAPNAPAGARPWRAGSRRASRPNMPAFPPAPAPSAPSGRPSPWQHPRPGTPGGAWHAAQTGGQNRSAAAAARPAGSRTRRHIPPGARPPPAGRRGAGPTTTAAAAPTRAAAAAEKAPLTPRPRCAGGWRGRGR
eukprot:scaffold4457_cov94-Isochrysis_galbana.AAC.4